MRRLGFTFLVVLVTTALAACGGTAATSSPAGSTAGSSPSSVASEPGSSPSSAAASASSAGAPCTVAAAGTAATVSASIKDFAFSPEPVKAKVGDVIVWTNNDSTTHTATVNSACTTGQLASGAAAGLVFSTAGTYPYLCSIHPTRMMGTIVIE